MRASQVLSFQATASSSLRRPWKTFKDGTLFYGQLKTGSKRHPLTTKQGNKDFYKGTGSSGIGHLDNKGRYHVNWQKVRTYVVPEGLHKTELKALVSPKSPQFKQKVIGYSDQFKSPELAFHNAKKFIELGPNYSEVDLEAEGYMHRIVHPNVLASEQDEVMEETPVAEAPKAEA
ncbi:54S ribosomal protein L27, mitochondrial [Candida viswanathii]|uniref:54S ribosomal protein L27, mitochondrial n=1 Tax=Candida viswanathii TaxID=5486 RepID=A0A367XSE9_9ASCO|nr:54S ribosomal protein L27, mitochondrial [Candida viswanathii]